MNFLAAQPYGPPSATLLVNHQDAFCTEVKMFPTAVIGMTRQILLLRTGLLQEPGHVSRLEF